MALPDFESLSVIRSEIKITKAGDGLSEALQLDPVALHHGDEIFVILKATIIDVQSPYAKGKRDKKQLVRKHVAETEEITLVDESAVTTLLKEAASRLAIARDAAGGKSRLDELDPRWEEWDEDERVLVAQHNTGVHADGLRKGCPLCADEQAAFREDAAAGAPVTPIKRARKAVKAVKARKATKKK